MKMRLMIPLTLAVGILIGFAAPRIRIFDRAQAIPVIGPIADDKLDTFIQETLRPLCERMRADKIRVNAAIARYALLTPAPAKTDVVSQVRVDASNYPAITGQNINDTMYALGLLKNQFDAIPDTNWERFCVRDVQVSN